MSTIFQFNKQVKSHSFAYPSFIFSYKLKFVLEILSSSLDRFGFAQKYFLYIFFLLILNPTPKKMNNIRCDPSEREPKIYRKEFLFSRAQKFYVYTKKKQIWSFLSFYSQANVEKCFLSLELRSLFLALWEFFIFFALCVPYSHFEESEKLTFTLSWICAMLSERAHLKLF